jgi:DNA-binding CsgD family transcriptional regulator
MAPKQNNLIAVFGLGCLLLATETDKIASIKTIGVNYTYFATSLISLLIFALLFMLYYRFGYPKARLNRLSLPVGVFYTLMLLVSFDLGILPRNNTLVFITDILSAVSEGILFFLWCRTLHDFGARYVVLNYGLALFVVATLSSLIILLKSDSGVFLFCIMPIISSLLLFMLNNQKSSASQYPIEDLRDSDFSVENWPSFILGVTLPTVLYAMVLGNIHIHWVGLQDSGSYSAAIQFGEALGAAASALIVFLFVKFFWSHNSLILLRFLIFPVAVIGLFTASFNGHFFIIYYQIMANITQKLIWLMIITAPFIIVGKQHIMIPWCIAFIAQQVGKTLSIFIVSSNAESTLKISSIIYLSLLLLIVSISVFLSMKKPLSSKSQSDPDNTASKKRPRLRIAVERVALTANLTKRETEIALLLMHGRNATYIANVLTISPATAKTHLRNIYTKMGIHSQQELMDLIDTELEK